MAVVENFKEALKQRIGAERYQMWFAHGIEFEFDSIRKQVSGSQDAEPIDAHCTDHDCTDQTQCTDHDCTDHHRGGISRGIVKVRVRGQFALDRVRKNFLRELRGAAMQVCGSSTDIEFCLNEPPAEQADLPLGDPAQSAIPETDASTSGVSLAQKSQSQNRNQPNKSALKTNQRRGGSRHGKAKSITNLIAAGAGAVRPTTSKGKSASLSHPKQLDFLAADEPRDSGGSAADDVASPSPMTARSFVLGTSNQLAHTAMAMVCQNPGMASPLFLCGPTGTGKTHMLAAIADQLRRCHRMRRVMHLSAEQFTNDFISSVGNSGITAFRRRYREVDALLIDDVQFLGSKQATLRELLYTVETLAGAGRPLVFSGLQSPTEIPGLSRELAGRMAAGLVCPIQPLDIATREIIFRRWIADRCPIAVPDAMIEQINSILSGDGRVISGVVNLINTLERMLGRVPTMDELRRFGGELLRASKPVATLSVIEMAVCEAFQLSHDTLRGGSQTRAVSQPRMLAMYLSRQLTSSAYTEIARHFGGKSHSTAISAEKNVKSWLEQGKLIGRGLSAMSAQEAIDRVESLLRSG